MEGYVMAKTRISSHALVRFLERGFDMDFTDIRIEAAVMLSKPSWKHVSDNDLVAYIEETMDMEDFRAKLYHDLNLASIIHETKIEYYKRMKSGLVAVIIKASRSVATILPSDYIVKGTQAHTAS
jgi:hypothetical protein